MNIDSLISGNICFTIDFSDEAKCIPTKAKDEINVYSAMTGYDAIQGNPMSSLVDPGVKARIFFHDCDFGYFGFVSDVRSDLQCDSDFSMKTIESMDQYEQERKSSNAFSAGAAASATALVTSATTLVTEVLPNAFSIINGRGWLVSWPRSSCK